jgi:NAD(P)H-dependent FMN reductase
MAAKTIRVGIINGSLRKDSNNSGLGRIVEEVKPANVEFIHLRIDDLPLVNEDLQVFTDGGKTVTLPETVNRIR